MQLTQYKSIKFNLRHRIGAKEFKETNWLQTKERVGQFITAKFFKYRKGTSSFYVN